MKITAAKVTKVTAVDPEVLNAAVDVIVAARNVLSRRTPTPKTFSNRIPSHVLDELDKAMRAWDDLP